MCLSAPIYAAGPDAPCPRQRLSGCRPPAAPPPPSRSARSFARDLTDFTLLFSSYPGSIYQGAVKVIAYSILPAGFVVMAPVEMLREPSLRSIAIVLAGAGGYAGLAATFFHLGLKRYRSGTSVV